MQTMTNTEDKVHLWFDNLAMICSRQTTPPNSPVLFSFKDGKGDTIMAVALVGTQSAFEKFLKLGERFKSETPGIENSDSFFLRYLKREKIVDFIAYCKKNGHSLYVIYEDEERNQLCYVPADAGVFALEEVV